MFDNIKLERTVIDQEKKRLYIYFKQDNSHLMSNPLSNPPPPPSYYREVFSFENLEFIEKEYAQVEPAKQEIIKWKDSK